MDKLVAYVYIKLDKLFLLCYNSLHNLLHRNGGILKNYIDFRLYEIDIIYILNCITLSKEILKIGDPNLFSKYFKKSRFNDYMYDLTNLQKLISYQGNRELYNYEDNDNCFLLSYHEYLRQPNKDFDFLKGKSRVDMLKRINKEIQQKKEVENNKIFKNELLKSIEDGTFRKKFYKKFIFLTKGIDKFYRV